VAIELVCEVVRVAGVLGLEVEDDVVALIVEEDCEVAVELLVVGVVSVVNEVD